MTNDREAPISPANLFPTGQRPVETVEGHEAEPDILPLGAFSAFVLKEQPALLAKVRAGTIHASVIAQRQGELLVGLGADVVERAMRDPDMARLAVLDLSFAMSGAIFSGDTPPDEVQKLNANLAQATGMPPKMTFEKVVSINSRLPFSQMRAFTDGNVGDTERQFYYGHDLMDRKIQDTTDNAALSIDALRTKGNGRIGEVVDLLSRGASNMEEFAKYMKSFMRMPREHFEEFRPYLSQYPDGTRNASGAFIGMPRLDIRLVGLSPRYEQFLDEGMRYFPIHEQADIQEARGLARHGDYLVAQCERLEGEERKSVARSLASVIEPIKDFRLRHLAAVNRFVSQALPEGMRNLKEELARTEEEPILDNDPNLTKGTAGFLPGPLLRNTLRLDLRALEKLNALLVKE